jgi:hypothetical protein
MLLQRAEHHVQAEADEDKQDSADYESVEEAPEGMYEKWVQERPGDVVTGPAFLTLGCCDTTYYKKNNEDAYVVGPMCSPPEAGFPGLIIAPGKGGGKERQIVWTQMFASRGIVAMAVEACGVGKIYEFQFSSWLIRTGMAWMRNSTWEYAPFFGGAKYGVNPDDVSVMGYSAGCEFINHVYPSTEFYTDKLLRVSDLKAKKFVCVSGNRGKYVNGIDFSHIDSTYPEYLAIQADDDNLMEGSGAAITMVNKLKARGVRAFMVQLATGGHQPFKPGVFYEIFQFILSKSYEGPSETLWNDGDLPGTWEEFSGDKADKACYQNSDAEEIQPIRKLSIDSFGGDNGRKVCQYLCLDTEGCVGFDLLNPRVKNTREGNLNCILHHTKCEQPKRKSSSHSQWLTAEYLESVKNRQYVNSYCHSPSATGIGYKAYSETNCVKSAATNVERLDGETPLSCAQKCTEKRKSASDGSDGCEGFQIGVNGPGKWFGVCLFKKDIQLDKCKTHPNWEMYLPEEA